jgi:LacI family transcriptional regulator
VTVVYQAPTLSANSRALLRGITNYSRLHGNWHLRITAESVTTLVPMLRNLGVDGAFLSIHSDAEAQMVMQCGIPCVLTHTSHPQETLPYLTANNQALGRMGAEHFIGKGFVNFGFFSLSNHLFWSKERLDGFRERVEETGRRVHVFDPLPTSSYERAAAQGSSLPWPPSSWTGNAEHLHHWIQSLPKPVGVMATDDGMGYDIIEASEEAGIRVPEELAVLGSYDDLTLCLVSNPPLSSIAVNMEQNGYRAAQLLHEIIVGRETMRGQRLVNEPTHIVTRQSTDILAVDDPDLAAALHFIRTNFSRPIRVADVVNQTATSRRGLEMRFRDHIKRSIADEIMRVKIEQITQMLLESDMSMERIADRLAFGSPARMREAFRKAKGTNPLDFRREHRKT